jgi:putative sigma-54 modulation protein
MQLQVTGHHVEVTSAMKSFIAGKLAKLEEIYPKVQKATVVLTVEKYRHTAEVHFRAEGVELNAKKTTKDMYASVEEAISALEQQAGKRKDRLRTGGALRRDAGKTEKRSERPSKKAAEPEAPKRPKVTKVKALAARSMDMDEAVEALNDSGQPWLLFRDSQGGGTHLLFRREDGSLGLAEG